MGTQTDFSMLLTQLRFNQAWIFDVTGRPTPQGSKSAHAVQTKAGKNIAVMRESSSEGLTRWREDVRVVSREHAPATPIMGPVAIGVQFRFRRPASHYGRKGGEPYLRSTEIYVTSRGVGDVDKLLRSTFDALASAQWFLDDSQLARLLPVEKVWVDHYTGQEGATILLAALKTTLEEGT